MHKVVVTIAMVMFFTTQAQAQTVETSLGAGYTNIMNSYAPGADTYDGGGFTLSVGSPTSIGSSILVPEGKIGLQVFKIPAAGGFNASDSTGFVMPLLAGAKIKTNMGKVEPWIGTHLGYLLVHTDANTDHLFAIDIGGGLDFMVTNDVGLGVFLTYTTSLSKTESKYRFDYLSTGMQVMF